MKKFWNKLKKIAATASQVEDKAVEIGIPVPKKVQAGFSAAELIISMLKKKAK